jgi:hypothetical protein
MSMIIVIALVFGAGIFSSPALARATNPSERSAHSEQQVGRAWAPETGASEHLQSSWFNR